MIIKKYNRVCTPRGLEANGDVQMSRKTAALNR